MMKNEADIGIVTRAIKNCYNTMACCLMDGGQFPNHYSKQRYGYWWAVEELIKYTYQPLSLNKSKESNERNVIKSDYSHSLTSQIQYMDTVLNELMENSSKKIKKSLLATGVHLFITI